MGRLRRFGSLAQLPRIYRTLRPLRWDQVRAQLTHALFGLPAPTRLPAADYGLALSEPITPFLPPPAHVKSLGPARAEFLSTPIDLSMPIDWTRTDHGPLFAYHLNQHEFLRTECFTPRERVICLLDWIERHPVGIGWDPHPISLRLLCWGKMLLTQGVLEFREGERARVLASMADQAETLSRGLEIRLQANHLFSNLLSVVFASLVLETRSPQEEVLSSGPDAGWRSRVPRFFEELVQQILPDGGHQERSPMYHALLLENVLDLLNVVRAQPARAPEDLEMALEDCAARMLKALAVWTHPDQRISLFSDAGLDIAAEPGALFEYAGRLGLDVDGRRSLAGRLSEGSAVLPSTGYVRLVAPEVSLLASTAGPAPAHQPGHAHCDALAFELCLGGRRVVTDTGLYEYRPGPRRDWARTTASHSTLQIDGEEQAEIWSAHRVGGRPRVALEGWDGERAADASVSGWSRPKTIHRRRFEVAAGEALIVDRIEGPAEWVRFALPIDPAWEVELDDDGSCATGRLIEKESPEEIGPRNEGAEEIGFTVDLPRALQWRIERAEFFPSFGRIAERAVLIGEGPGFVKAATRFRLGHGLRRRGSRHGREESAEA